MCSSSARGHRARLSAGAWPASARASSASSRATGSTASDCPRITSIGRCADAASGRPTRTSAAGRPTTRWAARVRTPSTYTCTTLSAAARSDSPATTGAWPRPTSRCMKVHDELAFMPATELLARIGRHDLSPVEVVDAFLERIGRLNKELNAYVLVLADEAMQKARDAEKALTSKQEHRPLLGLPIAIKDLF